MEFDDLDRELADYNVQSKVYQSSPTDTKKEAWIPFSDEDETDREALYQLQLGNLERIRTLLEKKLVAAREEHNGIDTLRRAEGEAVRKEWIGTVGFFTLVFFVLALFFNIASSWAWYSLLGILIIAFLVQIYQVAQHTVIHQVRCITSNASPFVEEMKIKTFAKQEDYCREQIGRVNRNLSLLEGYERKLAREKGLTEAELAEADKLRFVENYPSIYVMDKFTIMDCLKYKFGMKKF